MTTTNQQDVPEPECIKVLRDIIIFSPGEKCVLKHESMTEIVGYVDYLRDQLIRATGFDGGLMGDISSFADHMPLQVYEEACKEGMIDVGSVAYYASLTQESKEKITPDDVAAGNVNRNYTHVSLYDVEVADMKQNQNIISAVNHG